MFSWTYTDLVWGAMLFCYAILIHLLFWFICYHLSDLLILKIITDPLNICWVVLYEVIACESICTLQLHKFQMRGYQKPLWQKVSLHGSCWLTSLWHFSTFLKTLLIFFFSFSPFSADVSVLVRVDLDFVVLTDY